MIYLLGSENESLSTIEIQDWLEYKKLKYKKTLISDLINEVSLEINSSPDCIKNDAIWIWQSGKENFNHKTINVKVKTFLEEELEKLFEYVCSRMVQYPSLNKRSINKLVTLNLAQEVGLVIPETLVTCSKDELIEFYKKHGSIITKPIAEVEAFNFSNSSFALYTEEVNNTVIQELPKRFYPSLIQASIQKQYEVRSFYLDKSIYSMAIFSSNDTKTKVDFRKYNYQHPNRNVPYKLPEVIQNKIQSLMEKLKLNTGSIDLIKGIDEEYYFLEVNPVGQFGMVSKPCNYYLEETIAEKLKTYGN